MNGSKGIKITQQGFSLIEICVVMVIAGLILAGVLMVYKVQMERERIVTTKDSVKEAIKAIASFQSKYGYYPCPASREDTLGISTDCSAGAVAGTVSVSPGAGLPRVRIGVMPLSATVPTSDGTGVEEVQVVESSYLVDAYKRRLSYAVVEPMAIDRASYSATTAGSIRVTRPEGGDDITQSGRYIVFSHGSDGRGAYTMAGALHEDCNDGAVDGENCNDDAVFTGYMEAPRSFSGDDNNNDDIVGEAVNPSPAGTLNAMMGVTAGAVWASGGFSSLAYSGGNLRILDPDYNAALDAARASATPIVYNNAAAKDRYCRHIFGDIRCDLRLKSSSIRFIGGYSDNVGHFMGDHHGVSPEIQISCGSGGIVVVSTSGRAVRGDITFDAYGGAQGRLGVPYAPSVSGNAPTYQYFTDADYDSPDSQVGNAIYGCAEGVENARSSIVIPLIMYHGEASGDCGIC